jgi:hypothetical protein
MNYPGCSAISYEHKLSYQRRHTLHLLNGVVRATPSTPAGGWWWGCVATQPDDNAA